MDFKDLPPKVQTIVVLMHTVGVLESMCEAQNMPQEAFQNVLTQSFASVGIPVSALNDLIDGLNAEEDRVMNDYFRDHDVELADDDSEAEPKVH